MPAAIDEVYSPLKILKVDKFIPWVVIESTYFNLLYNEWMRLLKHIDTETIGGLSSAATIRY